MPESHSISSVSTKTETIPRAAIYARISVKDANVPKVEWQTEQCHELARQVGYYVVAELADDGVSAYKSGVERPDFEKLLALIADEQIDVVLAVDTDRLADRQGGIEALKFDALCTEHGIKVHTTRYGLQAENEETRELLTFLNGWRGRNEVKKNIRRQQDNNRKRRAEGKMRKAGVVPFGWNKDRTTLNDKEAALVRAGIDAILAGKPRWDVVKMFNASGLPTRRGQKHWMPSTVYDTLRRGMLRWWSTKAKR